MHFIDPKSTFTFSRCSQVVGLSLVIFFNLLVDELGNLFAIFLKRVERVLNSLVDCFLNIFADILNLVDAADKLLQERGQKKISL